MPTILGHALAAGTAYQVVQTTPARRWLPRWWWAALLVVLSCAPDLDVAAFAWVPYEHLLGHRGLWHGPFFAAGLSLVVVAALGLSWKPDRASHLAWVWAILAVVTASHGVLDCLTDGGLGIALAAPFSGQRYFAPWRPIPVAPIGPAAALTPYGWYVLAWEALLFGPAFLAARLLRRRTAGAWRRTILAMALIMICLVTWISRMLPEAS